MHYYKEELSFKSSSKKEVLKHDSKPKKRYVRIK